MKKYCKIINEETGLVQIGVGCPDEYYIEIGMEKRNVKQSDVDNEWYLYDECPIKPEPTPKDREQEFNAQFFNTSLGYIRRYVAMADGSKKDFLSDLMPTIKMGLESGIAVNILAYDKPPFDHDIEDWTEYQHIVVATPQFIQECFMQLSNDFLPINKE